MTALLFVDHGSRVHASHEQLENTIQKLATRTGRELFFAHMELAQPTIEHAFEKIREAGYTQVTVLPLFFAEGKHIREDIPALCAQAAQQTGLEYSIQEVLLEDPAFLLYLETKIESYSSESI